LIPNHVSVGQRASTEKFYEKLFLFNVCKEWLLYYEFGMTGQPVNLYHICFDVDQYQEVSIAGPFKIM
jgi:hypothetical protein